MSELSTSDMVRRIDDPTDKYVDGDLATAISSENLRSIRLNLGKLPKPPKSRQERLAELIELRRENDELEAKLIRRTFRVVAS